ncbi:MAG: twin-arginine translocase TatA/TatE family subunit [Verrucomicrobiota bacterium]|nr:twin-arginine translocase TatA/TatE family subunit [Verrucomicrobiota bacterium]
MNLGGPDMIVILLIILVLFGAKKLPDLAKGMGQAMREFQKAKDEFGHELTAPASVARVDAVNQGPAATLKSDPPAAIPAGSAKLS